MKLGWVRAMTSVLFAHRTSSQTLIALCHLSSVAIIVIVVPHCWHHEAALYEHRTHSTYENTNNGSLDVSSCLRVVCTISFFCRLQLQIQKSSAHVYMACLDLLVCCSALVWHLACSAAGTAMKPVLDSSPSLQSYSTRISVLWNMTSSEA